MGPGQAGLKGTKGAEFSRIERGGNHSRASRKPCPAGFPTMPNGRPRGESVREARRASCYTSRAVPELPELEVVREVLTRRLTGRRIEAVTLAPHGGGGVGGG